MSNMTWDKDTEEWVVRQSGDHGEDVSARTSSRRYYNSRDKGEVYSWKAAHTCSIDEAVFYIKNTDADNDLIFDAIQCKASVDCEFVICLVSGTASTSTEVTGVNWVASSINTATCEAKQDNITGLSVLGDIGDIDVLAGQPGILNLEGAVRLANGYALAITCNKAATININVFGEFE